MTSHEYFFGRYGPTLAFRTGAVNDRIDVIRVATRRADALPTMQTLTHKANFILKQYLS
jgi:hypothetical protein